MEFREEQETFPSATWERGGSRTDPATRVCDKLRMTDCFKMRRS